MTDAADEGWFWYCAHCETDLRRGDDALACDDPDECPYSAEWGRRRLRVYRLQALSPAR